LPPPAFLEPHQDIGKVPLLNWNLEQFSKSICNEHARLIIIDYGFGDRHINSILLKAAAAKAKFFIVDIAGIVVMDKRKEDDQIAQQLWGSSIISSEKSPRRGTSQQAAVRGAHGSHASAHLPSLPRTCASMLETI
jgi:hypothetical protein